jgi:hypothetical protein
MPVKEARAFLWYWNGTHTFLNPVCLVDVHGNAPRFDITLVFVEFALYPRVPAARN